MIYQKNVSILEWDLERIHAVVEGKTDNFKTSLFSDLEKYLDKSLNTKNINYTIKKIIMDHCRSSCFLIADGVIPSNEGRGYVLRRIIRRAPDFFIMLEYRNLLSTHVLIF